MPNMLLFTVTEGGNWATRWKEKKSMGQESPRMAIAKIGMNEKYNLYVVVKIRVRN